MNLSIEFKQYQKEPKWRPILFYLLAAIILVFFWSTILRGCASADEQLTASWYSVQSLKDEGTYFKTHGRCADGSYFKDDAKTCATRHYVLGTILEITNQRNGKSVCVKVCDRISKKYANTRIDLSKAAFAQIADLKQGIVPVIVKKLK